MRWILKVCALLIISCSANASLIAYDFNYSYYERFGGSFGGYGYGLLVADTEKDALVGLGMSSVTGHKFDFFWNGFSPIQRYGYFLSTALVSIRVTGMVNRDEVWAVDHSLWLWNADKSKSYAEQLNWHLAGEDISIMSGPAGVFDLTVGIFNKREIFQLPRATSVVEPASLLLLVISIFVLLGVRFAGARKI